MSLLKRNINMKGSAFPSKCNIYLYSKTNCIPASFFSSTTIYNNFENNVLNKIQQTRIVPKKWQFKFLDKDCNNFKCSGILFKPSQDLTAILLISEFSYQTKIEFLVDGKQTTLDTENFYFFDIERKFVSFEIDNFKFDGSISEKTWKFLKFKLTTRGFEFVVDYFKKNKNSNRLDFDLYVSAMCILYKKQREQEYKHLGIEKPLISFEKYTSSRIPTFSTFYRDFETQDVFLQIFACSSEICKTGKILPSNHYVWDIFVPESDKPWWLGENLSSELANVWAAFNSNSDLEFDGTISKESFTKFSKYENIDGNGYSFAAAFCVLKDLSKKLEKNKLTDFDIYMITKELVTQGPTARFGVVHKEGLSINEIKNLTGFCLPVYCADFFGTGFF